MTLQFLIVMIASAINDRLQRKLDYVEEERRVLREQLEAGTGGKKLSFTAAQRRRCVVESNGPQEVEAGRNGSHEGLGSVEGSAAGRLSGAGSCEGDYPQPPSGRRRFLAVSKATSGLKCRS